MWVVHSIKALALTVNLRFFAAEWSRPLGQKALPKMGQRCQEYNDGIAHFKHPCRETTPRVQIEESSQAFGRKRQVEYLLQSLFSIAAYNVQP